MNAVSVASVENLSDLVASLAVCREGAEESFREMSCDLERLVEEAGDNQREASQALEDARERVAQCQAEVDRIESEMEEADPPDNPGPSQGELDAALADLDEAKDHELACRARLDDAVALLHQSLSKQDAFLSNAGRSLSHIDDLAADCAARANHARQILEDYLSANPTSPAAAFCAWTRWTPPSGKVVDPAVLATRLHLTPTQLRQVVSYLEERDPKFKSKIESYRSRYRSAAGVFEKGVVLRDVSNHGSGDFAERLVELAFRPLGDVSTQDRTYFEDGRYTKTDLYVRNLKAPVIFGRGDRAFAPEGGALAIEVKAGHAPYLRAQKDHLVFQAGGHQKAHASATICTADIHDLSEEDERDLREAVRQAGSPIIGMLPRKDEIDQALFDAIVHGEEKDE